VKGSALELAGANLGDIVSQLGPNSILQFYFF
jgi:hypothetical protein